MAITIKQAKRIEVGRWVRVLWDDVGVRDGIVTENDVEHRRIHFLNCDFDTEVESVDYDQIVQVGGSLEAKYSGLR